MVVMFVKQQTATAAVVTGRFDDGVGGNNSDDVVMAGREQTAQLRSRSGQ